MNPNSEETEQGSSANRLLLEQEKVPGQFYCHAWKCVPTAVSGGVDVFEVSGCHLLQEVIYQ